MLRSKKTLVVGASPLPQRYAYLATEMLVDYGYHVIPFGIKKGTIGKLPIVNNWPSDEDIDTITLYISKTIQSDFYIKILNLQPRRIIFNPGTENITLEKLARDQGIFAQRACTLVLLRTNQY